ncbi:MAG TPA: SAM-dependent methyltransferase [Planctomycetota bacterium]|nr:SAM-dependent methyltransferase [Planctomycetota bacterium]
MADDQAAAGSFRDPDGSVYFAGGVCYRQINPSGRASYEALMGSGLYAALAGKGLLIPHEEVGLEHARTEGAYKVIRPEPLPFVSYPYEWCFSQLKDAALLTLRVQNLALDHGLILKDASAYNVQFLGGRPVFIDTLSFDPCEQGAPWVAYRQFCQHFLAPLALMHYVDVRLGQLLRTNIDGVPLDLAAAMLPRRTRLRPSLLMHIHLHARCQARYADRAARVRGRRVSRLGLLGLVDSLQGAIRRLRWRPQGTEWGEYYRETNYSDRAAEHKAELVARYLDALGPRTVWDLGANTGRFSRLAADKGVFTLAFDVDPACVETAYRDARERGAASLLPLLLDLRNPSPGIGWSNAERASLADRGPADAAMALALLHHLAISNNVPLDRIAAWLATVARALIIEFVPKSDSQVQRLLATREDVFPDYDREHFEAAFRERFQIVRAEPLRESERWLYLMRRSEVTP